MRKIRLGLFGAEDSLEILESVILTFPEFNCVSISYWHDDEIIEKLNRHREDVDMWLFSGQIPYGYAKKRFESDQPMFYVPSTGSSLYRVLLHIAYQRNIPFDRLSFDTFHPSELKQVFTESEIGLQSNYLKHYEEEISTEEVVQYHYQLWKEGKTLAAVTCLKNAQHALIEKGVPSFRVLPAHSAIISTLALIRQTHETLHFKDSQIAVQMIEFDSFSRLTKDTFLTDDLHKIEIKMTEKLLDYAKKVDGSLKSAGPGRYIIFTTRGLLEEITKEFTVIPDHDVLRLVGEDAGTCGIGIGQTAYEAERNAGIALLHAREHRGESWMVVFDDKTIVGPLGQPTQIHYGGASKQLQSISAQTSLSVATLSKLQAILRKKGEAEMSAHDLAQYMNLTPRSARRILTGLEENGLAKVVAEETLHPRGRPRRIYQIKLL